MSKVVRLFAPTLQHALVKTTYHAETAPVAKVIPLDAYRDFHSAAQIDDLEARIVRAGS